MIRVQALKPARLGGALLAALLTLAGAAPAIAQDAITYEVDPVTGELRRISPPAQDILILDGPAPGGAYQPAPPVQTQQGQPYQPPQYQPPQYQAPQYQPPMPPLVIQPPQEPVTTQAPRGPLGYAPDRDGGRRPPASAACACSPDRALEMVRELEGIIETAERYRAASPGVIEDLQALIAKYSVPAPAVPIPTAPVNPEPQPQPLPQPLPSPPAPIDPVAEPDPQEIPDPQQTENPYRDGSRGEGRRGDGQRGDGPRVVAPNRRPPVFADDFADGDFSANPAWTVRKGQWGVDPASGLRAIQETPDAQRQLTPQDLLAIVMSGQLPNPRPTQQPTAALIEAATTLPNAFDVRALLTDHAGEGAAHLILHQGGSMWLGYRLEVRGGAQPRMVLTRRGASGYEDLATAPAPGLTQGQAHRLRWRRDAEGQMTVWLNGEQVLGAIDRVFQDDWTGLAFFNAGGDMALRRIAVANAAE